MRFIDSNTCFKVIVPVPACGKHGLKIYKIRQRCYTLMTGTSPSDFSVFLMNLKRCFWFMQAAAWIWVSTCAVGKVSKHQLPSYFSHVVEVPVGNGLLLSQLSDLIEQVVQLIPGLGLTEQTFETRKVHLKVIIVKLQRINFIASLEPQHLLSFVKIPKYFQVILLITRLHK